MLAFHLPPPNYTMGVAIEPIASDLAEPRDISPACDNPLNALPALLSDMPKENNIGNVSMALHSAAIRSA